MMSGLPRSDVSTHVPTHVEQVERAHAVLTEPWRPPEEQEGRSLATSPRLPVVIPAPDTIATAKDAVGVVVFLVYDRSSAVPAPGGDQEDGQVFA